MPVQNVRIGADQAGKAGMRLPKFSSHPIRKFLAGISLFAVVMIATALGTTAYVVTSQLLNVTGPLFIVSVASSASGVTCTGTTTISCPGISLAVGQTETLTATITYGTASQTTFTASSSAPSIATITPAGPTMITATSQAFTITGIAVGTATITLGFN
jgi:uncharacterized protein YjdB